MSDQLNSAAQTPQAEMSVIQKIINVFVSPKQTFESIDRKPDWVIPFVIILLVAIAFMILTMPVLGPIQMEKQRAKMEERGMSDQQIEQAMSIADKPIMKIIGPVIGTITIIIIFLAISGIVMLVGNMSLGTKASFKKVFSAFTYTSLIGSLNQLLILPIMLNKNSAEVHFSLATFQSVDNADTLMYQFLKKIDLFAIWQIAVLGIGLAIIYRTTTKKSTTMVAGLYVVYMAISLVWFSITN
ncbi:YIP1 family protein [candidate division KSB1 bacterium]|nr:YIP1 family protein [candidate division KSB1 bacterium]